MHSMATHAFQGEVDGLVQALEKELGTRLQGSAPFRRICELLVLQECTHLDIEEEYYCRDFMSEYSFLYGRIMENVERLARRVHFFRNGSFGNEDYLGYVVLRPIKRHARPAVLSQVGRTLLRYDYDKERQFLRCGATYDVHLRDEAFALYGAPFIQQDTQVMCCAHAAMWVANRLLSRNQAAIRDFYPHEIALMSTQRLAIGPTLPTPGLVIDQILGCIQQMGFEPLYYDYGQRAADDRRYADGILYRYVESGIPSIVITPGHAVCAVGHTFDASLRPPFRSLYLTPTTWISHFIVNDDASGPYMLLPNRPGNKQPDAPGQIPYSLQRRVQAIIVPLPKNILITGEAAERRAFDILYTDHRVCQHVNNQAAGEHAQFAAAYRRGRLVLRTFLEQSHQLKRRMTLLAAEGHAPSGLKEIAERYRNVAMPRYVWVTEISTPDSFAAPLTGDRKMFGEIITDATSSPYAEPEFAVHVPGFLRLNDPREPYGTKHVHALKDDKPYKHCVLDTGN